MNAGDVAFAALGGCEASHASDVKRLGAESLANELARKKIETHAMTADDDEIGRFQSLPEKLHRNRFAGIEHLSVLVDGDEAVSAAERRDRTRSLTHRIGQQTLLSLYQADEQILGPSPLGIDAHRQRRGHVLLALRGKTGKGADHGRQEFMKREDGRGRKARQDHDRLAIRYGEADR